MTPTFPTGTETEPTGLAVGRKITLICTITYGSSVVIVAGVRVTSVSGTPYTSEDMVMSVSEVSTTPDYVYQATKEWTVPELSVDTKLKFTFGAVSSDKKAGLASSYAIIGQPSGYFEVGTDVDAYVKADESSYIVVSTPNLNLRFTATNQGDQITNVEVKIYKGTTLLTTIHLPETTTDKIWERINAYTLPGAGRYTVEGYYYAGTSAFRGMSLITTISGEATSIGELFNIVTIFGIIVTLASYVLGKRTE